MANRKAFRNISQNIMKRFVNLTRLSAVWTYVVTFTVWLSLAYTSAEGTKPGVTCFDELLIHPCEGLNRVDKTIKDVDWEAKNSKSGQWSRFAYCNQLLTCIAEQPTLPNGVKVTNVSKGNLILQPSAKTMTDGITELQCVVHYSDSTRNTPHVIKIHYSNFTVCIRAQKASDVNFTRVLRNVLSWQQVVDVEFFDTSKRKLAYCHTSNCTKETIGGSDAVPAFWYRLRVKQGSLLLTNIKMSDDELESRVKVHLNDDSVLVYTLKIFVVNGSHGTEIAPLTTATPTYTATPTETPTAIPTTILGVTTTATPSQAASSSLPPSWHPETPSSVPAVLGQEWTAVLNVVAVFLGIVLRD